VRVTVTEAGRVLTQTAGQEAEADAAAPVTAVSEVGVERVVADKGYYSTQVLQELAEVGVGTLIAEPERRRQPWEGQRAAQAAGYANRRRLKSRSGQALMRRRGTLIERPFAHPHDTGGLRWVGLRGQDTIAQRLLIHAAAFRLSLILRQRLGVGTARQATDLLRALRVWLMRLLQAANHDPLVLRSRPFTARSAHPPRRRNLPQYR